MNIHPRGLSISRSIFELAAAVADCLAVALNAAILLDPPFFTKIDADRPPSVKYGGDPAALGPQ